MHCRSHKGSALSLLVELLAGAAVGAAVEDKMAEQSWGNLIVAVDPSLLGDAHAFQVIFVFPVWANTSARHVYCLVI